MEVPDAVAIEWKLLRRSYEPMLLLKLLDPVRGEHVGRSTDRERSALSPTELRRSFADKLAYLCDFKKGGDTTTAIALQSTPQGVVIHCASNDPMKPRVIDFIRSTLNLLSTVNEENHTDIETEIFKKAITLGRVRLRQYGNFTNRLIVKCLKHLQRASDVHSLLPLLTERKEEQGESSSVSDLGSWLEELQSTLMNIPRTVSRCYEARGSPLLRAILARSQDGQPHHQAFKDLHHYLGRLGAHRKATKTVVAAAVRMPGLLEGFSIRVEPSSAHRICRLLPRDTTAFQIMGRMCPKSGAEQYRDALKQIDVLYGLNLDALLARNCTFKTRVHAEVLLLDLFLRTEFEFAGSDKYIGCSKPACYSCYQYFRAQSASVVLPACHNKLYLCWRPPDIFNPQDLVSIKRRNDTMNQMNVKIREEIKEQLEIRVLSRRHHFDSTSGGSFAIGVGNNTQGLISQHSVLNTDEGVDSEHSEYFVEDEAQSLNADTEEDIEASDAYQDFDLEWEEHCEDDAVQDLEGNTEEDTKTSYMMKGESSETSNDEDSDGGVSLL